MGEGINVRGEEGNRGEKETYVKEEENWRKRNPKKDRGKELHGEIQEDVNHEVMVGFHFVIGNYNIWNACG